MNRVPRDLVAVAALTALAGAVLLGPETGPPLSNPLSGPPVAAVVRLATVALGLTFVLFLPGYAVVASLFPRHESAIEAVDDAAEPMPPRFQFRSRESLDALERVTLAIGVSVVLVPVLAAALNFTPVGIRPRPLILLIVGVTLAATLLAAVRRLRVPVDERFDPSIWPAASPLSGESGERELATVVLVLGLLVAAVGIGYAVAVPKPGTEFTELYVVTQNDSGEYVARDYPDLQTGEPTTYYVGVENHEGRQMNYTGVVQLQRVNDSGDLEVQSRERAGRFELSLRPGETERVPVNVTTDLVEDGLRLQVLLYRDAPSQTPRASSAYRNVSLWTNASRDHATWNFDGESVEGASTEGVTRVNDGVSGSALQFSGNETSYFEANVQAPQRFTVSLWVKPERLDTTDENDWRNVLSTRTGPMFVIEEYRGLLFLVPGVEGPYVRPDDVNPPGEWTHIAGTYNGTHRTVYIDGRRVGTEEIGNGTVDWGGTIRIGSNFSVGTAHDFDGVVDEVRIYNRSLAPEEIRDLYDERNETESMARVGVRGSR